MRNCRTVDRMRKRYDVQDGVECQRMRQLSRLIWPELCGTRLLFFSQLCHSVFAHVGMNLILTSPTHTLMVCRVMQTYLEKGFEIQKSTVIQTAMYRSHLAALLTAYEGPVWFSLTALINPISSSRKQKKQQQLTNSETQCTLKAQYHTANNKFSYFILYDIFIHSIMYRILLIYYLSS